MTTAEHPIITEADDIFHKRTDHPYWNESGWFGFNIPERQTSGCMYIHQRPNRGYAWAGLILWDPTANEIHDCLWHDFAPQHLEPAAQTPLQAKVFEFTTPGGLTVRNPEPLQRFEFEYDRGPCHAELVWDAFMDPFPTGLAKGWDEWGGGHFEQGGRVTGHIILDGERYDIDCLGARDRSWGPHDVSGIARGGFTWGVATEDHAWLSQATTLVTPAEDTLF
jgi:hypothetical protein